MFSYKEASIALLYLKFCLNIKGHLLEKKNQYIFTICGGLGFACLLEKTHMRGSFRLTIFLASEYF